ncbi:MAG: M23 family metallopeptidase [Ruminococcaceae bacterium]|nr:M23 family metallopeptidase [Oscillospiraceae bacterium]
MKKKLIFILVALLCLIPTVVAISSYNKTQNAPVDYDNATSISIDDINGKNFTLEKEEDGDEADDLIKYFLDLKKHSQKISALPDSLMGEKSFKVTIATPVREESYSFYFSPDPATNYFVAPNGSTYKMSEEEATKFITSKYAESIYDNSTVPALTLSDTIEVSPDSATWKYKNYTGTYVETDTSGLVSAESETHSVEGGLNLEFDIAPDYSSVRVLDTADDSVLYEGNIENLSIFTLTESKTVAVELQAKWYEDPARSFCGEMNYAFISHVLAPAEFYLGLTTVESGRFTAITALNVTDPSAIEFSTSMANTISPKFYSIGDNVAVALLPVHADIPSGHYTLSFKYGGITQDTILTVQNTGEKISYYTVPEDVVTKYRSAAAVEEWVRVSGEIMSKSEATKYFSGYFLEGVTGASIQRGFGRDIYLNGSKTITYRNNGVDYACTNNLDVVACNAGVVCYAGSLDYTGNIVVIDHGLGLKTWYYNMGSVSVNVGDKVARGDKIGVTGRTGFTGSNGVHIAMSVADQFVSPYDTWQDSEVAGKVLIAKVEE